MSSPPQREYDALSRKIFRLIGANQLSALLPSQRSLLTVVLYEKLDHFGTAKDVSLEEIAAQFERIAGFSPTLPTDVASIDET